QRIREAFRTGTSEQSADPHFEQRVQEAEQMAQYARAQRTYAALVERYNPGMTMTEKEKIRLTARRVGFDLPIAEEGGRRMNGIGYDGIHRIRGVGGSAGMDRD
ncbi:LYR motif-containing protein, partial [Aspergillus novofumigatus IBT 16806]